MNSLRYYLQHQRGACDDCGVRILIFGGLREQRLQFLLAGWSWEPNDSSPNAPGIAGASTNVHYIETRCPACRWRRWRRKRHERRNP